MRQKRRQKRSYKRVKMIIMLLLVILVAVMGVVWGKHVKEHNQPGFDSVASEDKIVHVMILGIDSRQGDTGRSDTMMVTAVDTDKGKAALLSVPRDTRVPIEGHGYEKINHAYAYGKAPLALSTLNTNLDLDIKKYVTINFESVVQIVDAIGGVSLDITSAEATQIPGINSAGTYTLTGKQALAYGRIRKIDNDYARTERMRNVLIKVFEKIKGYPYSNLNSLIDELFPYVTTNISQKEILSYASKINQYKVVGNFGWPYEIRGITLAAWYGVPVTLESNVKKLHEDLFAEEYEVSETVKEISENIINRTGYRN